MNKPQFQLFPNDVLCELVRQPEKTLEKWDTYRGIHPSLRRENNLQQLAKLTAAPMPAPSLPYREYDNRNKAFERSMIDYKAWLRNERKTVLQQLKKLLAETHGLHITNLFLSEKIQPEVADLGTKKALKAWQDKLIKETCETHHLDYSLISFSLY